MDVIRSLEKFATTTDAVATMDIFILSSVL